MKSASQSSQNILQNESILLRIILKYCYPTVTAY